MAYVVNTTRIVVQKANCRWRTWHTALFVFVENFCAVLDLHFVQMRAHWPSSNEMENPML